MHALLGLFSSVATGALGALGAAADFWDFKYFEKDSWSQLMKGLRIALTLGGALLLLYEVRAAKLGERIRERTKKRVAVVLTILGFGVYFDFFNPNVRYSEYYHRHEFFHYYMGSKYAKELGYTRIYECTAIAEIELGRLEDVQNRDLRDLHDSLIKPVKSSYVLTDPDQCKKRFTPEHWQKFKDDVVWFEANSRGDYWREMQKDHGYNPPPVWTMTGQLLSRLAPAGDGFFKLLSALDVLLNLGMVLLLGWAFGWRVMTVGTVFWAVSAPNEFYWTGGAFLRQDWLFLLVAAVALARKRRFALAGAAATWSALLRVFPAILFVGWVLAIALELFQKRSLSSSNKRLIVGSLIAAAVLVPPSMLAAGADAYPAFAKNIVSRQAAGATNRMGLETMVQHDWDRRMRFLRDDNLSDPFEVWKRERSARLDRLKPLYVLVIGFVFAWTLWALRRTKLLWAAVPLGLPLVVAVADPACYYYSMFIVTALLIRQCPSLGPLMLATAGGSQILHVTYFWIDDRYAAEAWLFFIFGLMVLYAYSRPFSVARLRAWWHREPETPPKRAALSAHSEAAE